MKEKVKEEREFVKIIIGDCKTGSTGLKNSKSISLEDTSVEEVYKKIKEMIKNSK